MLEIYYKIDYRLGNSWQPIAKSYKSYVEASAELHRLVEEEKTHKEGRLTDAYRIVEFVSRISMEEIKVVEVRS